VGKNVVFPVVPTTTKGSPEKDLGKKCTCSNSRSTPHPRFADSWPEKPY
jgi:hypothetical protein